MKKIFFFLLSSIILFSCNQKQSFDPKAIEKEAQTAAHSLLDNLSKNDTTAIMSTFSQNKDFTVIMNNKIVNKEEFYAEAHQMLPNIEKQTFEDLNEKFLILSPETFIYSFTSINKMYEKNGVVITLNPILGSYTFQKEADAWKVIHMHETWANMLVDSSMVKK